MYSQLVSQHTNTTVDSQMKDQKISRNNTKIIELEKQISSIKEYSNNIKTENDALKEIIKKKLPEAEEILSQSIFNQNSPVYVTQTNILKSIKGGGGKRRTMLMDPNILSSKLKETSQI